MQGKWGDAMQHMTEFRIPEYAILDQANSRIPTFSENTTVEFATVDGTLAKLIDEFVSKQRAIDRALKGITEEIRHDIDSKMDYAYNLAITIGDMVEKFATQQQTMLSFRSLLIGVLDTNDSFEHAKSLDTWERYRSDFIANTKNASLKQKVETFYRKTAPAVKTIDRAMSHIAEDFNAFVDALANENESAAQHFFNSIFEKIQIVWRKCGQILEAGLDAFA